MPSLNFRTHHRKLLGLTVIALSTVLALAICWIIRSELSYLEAKPSASQVVPESWEKVTINTTDELKLSAWYRPSSNGATIIFLHGSGGKKSELLPEAMSLVKQGFGALLYDARGHGESDGNIRGYGQEERKDLTAAIDWLIIDRNVDGNKIGAYGFSVGGLTLVGTAAEDKRISSLVLAGTPTSIMDLAIDEETLFARLAAPLKLLAIEYGKGGATIDARVSVAKVHPVPILFLYGALDRTVPVPRANELFASAGYPKQMIIFPDAGHGEYRKLYRERLDNLLFIHYSKSLSVPLSSATH